MSGSDSGMSEIWFDDYEIGIDGMWLDKMYIYVYLMYKYA